MKVARQSPVRNAGIRVRRNWLKSGSQHRIPVLQPNLPQMHVWLFDIDGTLLDTGGAGRQAFENTLVHHFGLKALSGTVPFCGRTDRAIASDLFRLHGIPDSQRNWSRFVAYYLVHLERALHEHAGRVLAGVGELLHLLVQREDCAVGLLTGNISSGAKLKLSHYGLENHFRFGGYGDSAIDRGDVAVAAAEAAVHSLGVPLQNLTLHVLGDTPHDIRSARRIGASAVAVSTGRYTADQLAHESPDHVVDDLCDAAGLIRRLLAPIC